MPSILVVEDDKLLGKSVVGALKDAGFEVYWAVDATEAMNALQSNPINLIYLDIMLPGNHNGYNILQQIKQSDSPHRDIPVIMLSNLGQMQEIDQAMQMGASDYIVKANIDLDSIVALTLKKLNITT